MILKHIDYMISLTIQLQEAILLDIEDVKQANHEGLIQRNDEKIELMQTITSAHNELNTLLANEMANGVDVNCYRDSVNALEEQLRKLFDLNGKLASIVLPVQQMYKEIIDEISSINGGNLIEVRA